MAEPAQEPSPKELPTLPLRQALLPLHLPLTRVFRGIEFLAVEETCSMISDR